MAHLLLISDWLASCPWLLCCYCYCYSVLCSNNQKLVVTLSHVRAVSFVVSICTNRLPVPVQEPAFPPLIAFSHYWHQFLRSQPRRLAHACDPGGALNLQVVHVSVRQFFVNLLHLTKIPILWMMLLLYAQDAWHDCSKKLTRCAWYT